MPKDKEPKRYPFPEIIENGENFKIRETDVNHQSIDYTTKTLRVPLSDGALDHNIRLQMQAKMQWSSFYLGDTSTRVPMPVLQAVEDLRLTHLMQRKAGLMTTSIGFMDPDIAKLLIVKAIKEKDLRVLTLFVLGHGHTQVEEVLREELKKQDFKEAEWALLIVDEALRLMEDSELTPGDRIRIAERVEQLIDEFTEPPEAPEPEPDDSSNLSNEDQQLINEHLQESLEEMMEQMLKMAAANKGRKGRWGKLNWDRPGLYHYVRPRMVERRIRASEEGSFIRDITRSLTDQKIFGVINRRQGGSVLIDCSGSMGLSIPVIRALVRAAPAVTIALYNGNPTTGEGVLRVIVANGRMCDDQFVCHPNGGSSNVIDGLAMRLWMSQQSEPRIWVSDGYVNGSDGLEAGNLYDEVINLMRRYRIIRVSDVGAAFKFFLKLEQGKGQLHPVQAHRNALELEKIKNR